VRVWCLQDAGHHPGVRAEGAAWRAVPRPGLREHTASAKFRCDDDAPADGSRLRLECGLCTARRRSRAPVNAPADGSTARLTAARRRAWERVTLPPGARETEGTIKLPRRGASPTNRGAAPKSSAERSVPPEVLPDRRGLPDLTDPPGILSGSQFRNRGPLFPKSGIPHLRRCTRYRCGTHGYPQCAPGARQ
jgi:hypothetical protein